MNKYTLLAAGLLTAFAASAQQQIYVEDVQQQPVATVEAAVKATPVQLNNRPIVDGAAIQEAISAIPQNDQLRADAIAAQSEQYFAQQPQETEREKFAKKIAEKWKPTQTFELLPSENIVIPVARGLMNSIATNFKMLSARSSDEESIIEVEQGYLYVTINSDQPVGFILYEEGVMDSQVSVTLWPIDVPASIVKIDVSMSDDMKVRAEDYRKNMELEEKQAQVAAQEDPSNKSNDHSKRIIGLLTPVAQGDLPRGFTLTNDIPVHQAEPCQVAIKQLAGQRLTGGREVIDVVLMTNDSNRTYHVREEMCLAGGVKAVSVFEKAYLQPGEQTEVYILRDKLYEQEVARKNRRPRLIGTQND